MMKKWMALMLACLLLFLVACQAGSAQERTSYTQFQEAYEFLDGYTMGMTYEDFCEKVVAAGVRTQEDIDSEVIERGGSKGKGVACTMEQLGLPRNTTLLGFTMREVEGVQARLDFQFSDTDDGCILTFVDANVQGAQPDVAAAMTEHYGEEVQGKHAMGFVGDYLLLAQAPTGFGGADFTNISLLLMPVTKPDTQMILEAAESPLPSA